MSLNSVSKGRYFACIVYPENISFDAITAYLSSLHIPCAISPLHEPEEGKKQHYHILMKYANVTTKKHVDSLLEPLKGTKSIVVSDELGYYRYLTHKDDFKKQQFDVEPTCLCGYVPPVSAQSADSLMTELVLALPQLRAKAGSSFIFSYVVQHYASLKRFDMIKYISSHAFFVNLCL